MIIVTGTKRSGTSMWMQILQSAGLKLIGEAFPAIWKETIEGANPQGFFESPLRRGIYYATNPHPKSGQWLPPGRATRNIGVKVFIPGLVRSDLAYISRVVATMRHWREYEPSLNRLLDMEHAAIKAQKNPDRVQPARLPAGLEWWLENFMLIRDIATRRYPLNITTYDSVLKTPEGVIPEVLSGLGIPDLNIDLAIASVSTDLRTQTLGSDECMDHPHADVFDELYDHVHNRVPLTPAFLKKLNDTHVKLIPEIEEAQKQVLKQRSKKARKRPRATDPDLIEMLVHPPDLRD